MPKPTAVCSINDSDCSETSGSRGWCAVHYARWYRLGDPTFPTRTPPGTVLRFFLDTYRTPAAHDPGWPYATNGQGYGVVTAPEYGRMGAHLYACILTHGDRRAEDLQAAHSCHTPACFWIEHLTWKTRVENAADRVPDGTNIQGEAHYAAKMTEAMVREIRARYAAGGVTYQMLSDEYGLGRMPLWRIVNRISWKHVE